jgi:hypothetical protein
MWGNIVLLLAPLVFLVRLPLFLFLLLPLQVGGSKEDRRERGISTRFLKYGLWSATSARRLAMFVVLAGILPSLRAGNLLQKTRLRLTESYCRGYSRVSVIEQHLLLMVVRLVDHIPSQARLPKEGSLTPPARDAAMAAGFRRLPSHVALPF